MITRCRRTSRWSRRVLPGALALLMAVSLAGCSSTLPREHWWQFWRPKPTSTAGVFTTDRVVVPPPPETVNPTTSAGGTTLPPPPVSAAATAEPPVVRSPGTAVSDLQMIHFDYDSADLSPQAKATLDQNAQWLLQHPGLQILIEGHCDERGSVEYNLNLGERRANAVRDYLIGKSVAPDTLHTMSYGKERPLDPAHTDAAYGQNRRAQFFAY